MSDETSTCPKCGKTLDLCKCQEITVKHEFPNKDEDAESVKKERDELKDIVTVMALKSFDEEKQKLVDSISDAKKKKYVEDYIQTPEQLEQVKLLTNIITTGAKERGITIRGSDEDDGTEFVPHSGSARASPESSSGKEKIKEQIDEYFDILENPSKSQKEKQLANERINSLYAEFRRGVRESGQKTYQIPPTQNCPKCGQTMFGFHCYTCGYSIPEIQRK